MKSSFDYTRKLVSAGFSKLQTDQLVKTYEVTMENILSNKQEIKDLKIEMDRRFDKIEAEMKLLENRMTIKLGSMIVVSHGILLALLKM